MKCMSDFFSHTFITFLFKDIRVKAKASLNCKAYTRAALNISLMFSNHKFSKPDPQASEKAL